MAVGTVATIWDGKVAGLWLALESVAVSPVLVFADSQMVIASVRSAAACRLVRIVDLDAMVDLVGELVSAGVPI